MTPTRETPESRGLWADCGGASVLDAPHTESLMRRMGICWGRGHLREGGCTRLPSWGGCTAFRMRAKVRPDAEKRKTTVQGGFSADLSVLCV